MAAAAATDVDDLVLLTILFALAARTGSALRGRDVVAGQLLGIAALLAVSAAAAFGLLAVDERLVALLGLISPEGPRAFEAGPGGLSYLTFGPHHDGDGAMVEGPWEEGRRRRGLRDGPWPPGRSCGSTCPSPGR